MDHQPGLRNTPSTTSSMRTEGPQLDAGVVSIASQSKSDNEMSGMQPNFTGETVKPNTMQSQRV